MAKFCSHCGAPIEQGNKFCMSCGAKLTVEAPPEPAPEPIQEAQPTSEPTPAPEAYSASAPETATAPDIQQVPESEPVPAPKAESEPAHAPVETVDETPRQQSFNAAATVGETALGSIKSTAFGAATAAIPGPMKVIGGSAKQFFSSIKSSLKDPKRLIPAIVLAVIWLALAIMQTVGFNPIPVKVMAFITFAEAGMSGGFFGAMLGIIGKGVFAGAVSSLVGTITNKNKGEKTPFGQKIKSAFGFSLDTLFPWICGLGAAILFLAVMSGGVIGRFSFMGGVGAAFLAAKSAVSNGFVRKLTASLTKKNAGGRSGNGVGFVSGMTVGFTLSAFLGLLNINLVLVIIGASLSFIGLVLTILQNTGVIKMGKGAMAQ